MKYLIVVDMQVDFISGSLSSEQAKAIVSNVVEKVKNFDGRVIFTKDTHSEDYMNTFNKAIANGLLLYFGNTNI